MEIDPESGKRRPAMPDAFARLASEAAKAAGFASTTKVALHHGDVMVWGGVDRLRYHGVMPLKDEPHPLLGSQRINLTFRKAAA